MTNTRSALPPKFDISPDDIARVVARFYARVRGHDTLGPVFAAHVENWPEHEEKIARFWRNAILNERVYDGSPQRAHMAADEIRAAHFALWLGLFDETLTQEIDADAAAKWSALAHRIGRALRMGIVHRDQDPDAPPSLF
ncbi:group III truncated hemoglobin [Celeribacter sp.]|uniref:group III truncated hemoglobin n=1 Tax=Celeribacter sp. TaxID=1890673 RepID=UPI003A94A0AC